MLEPRAINLPHQVQDPRAQARSDEALRAAARELEANFLAEMLKAAGVARQPAGFGGGEGEDQYASFLRLEEARAMTKAGGIGLAESLFEALKEKRDGI